MALGALVEPLLHGSKREADNDLARRDVPVLSSKARP
jgi:hypothetical protein